MITESRKKALGIYNTAQAAHKAAFIELSRLKDAVRANPDLNEIVDCIAILKKAEELMKDAKSEILKGYEIFEKVACHIYVKAGITGEPIRTDWVTGSPDAKTIPKLPTIKNNPKEYEELLKFFGVSEQAIHSEAFRPHWPGMVEYITNCEANFQPLPPGINKNDLETKYTVRCLWKRDVELDNLCSTYLTLA